MAKKQSEERDHSNDPNRQPLSGPQELFLKRLYYERFPGAGYHALYEATVREAPSTLPHIYRNQVREWLNTQELYQRNKQPPPKRDIRRIQATSVSRVYQLDLIDMGESRAWKGYRYILNVVDVASRKLFLEPLKKKTEGKVYLAFKKIANHEHFGNNATIHMDNGGEFAAIKRDPAYRCVLGKPHVPMAQGMVESHNKQVRRYVNMYLQQGYKDWPMALPRFQDSLNSLSRKGTGGLSPNEAHEMPKEESKAYFEELKAKRTRNDDPLNDNLLPLGATVRYRLPYKSQLEAKNQPTYSATLHTIVQRRKGTGISSPSYKISDMPRWYNASDLQVIKKVEAYEREKRPVVQRVKNTSNVVMVPGEQVLRQSDRLRNKQVQPEEPVARPRDKPEEPEEPVGQVPRRSERLQNAPAQHEPPVVPVAPVLRRSERLRNRSAQ